MPAPICVCYGLLAGNRMDCSRAISSLWSGSKAKTFVTPGFKLRANIVSESGAGTWLSSLRYCSADAMPAYIIARVEVTDWVRYREYTKATPEVIAHYGGKFIVRGGESVTLEG